jgi:glycosyltransferase involved in cell wall biosynthesis
VTNRDHARYLPALLRSLRAQTVPFTQIVVVDDASTDGSTEYLTGQTDIELCHSGGSGQAAAWGVGLSRVTGDLTLLIDSDDVCVVDRVERVIQMYAEKPLASWIFHDVVHTTSPESRADVPNGALYELRDVDDRYMVRSVGRISVDPPATSGLTFRTSLLRRLLPTLTSDGVTISDNYLKFGALGLARGAISDARLSCLRLHNANRYTGKDNLGLRRSIALATAMELQTLDRDRFELLCGSLIRGAYPGGDLGLTPLGRLARRRVAAQVSPFIRLRWIARAHSAQTLRRAVGILQSWPGGGPRA